MAALENIQNSMTNVLNGVVTPHLSSAWDGLNPHLIASFYPVKRDGDGEKRKYVRDTTDNVIVQAPILEGAEWEYQLNWQSPFEQSSTENKAPALMAMLQSGTLTQAINGFTAQILGKSVETSQTNEGFIQRSLKSAEGRTGITKLNSTQVFTGMPPAKCNLKLLFRARTNPEEEVMLPIKKLLQWAMPQKLSPDGMFVNIAQAATTEESSYLDVLMPSVAPHLIAMEYKSRIYSPLVIEMISDPITSPTTVDGKYARAEITMSLSSLTAWDQADIANTFRGFK